MNKVTFDIEFTVNSLVELIGRASISRREAENIPGLVDNIDTVITLGALQPMEVEYPGKAKRGAKGKKKQEEKLKEKSVKVSEDEDDDMDDEGEELDILNMQPQIESGDEYDEFYESENDENVDDDQDDEMDMMMNYENKKRTKRQRGQLELELQLPLKKSRRKNQNEEDDQLKKLEKDEKRRQQMKKHIERQRMDTLNQILNETGRKQRLRNEKETKDKQSKQNKIFKTLGDVPKVTLHMGRDEEYVILHNTTLFSEEMVAQPVVRVRKDCYRCGAKGKYRVEGDSMVCSLVCYKQHQSQLPQKMEVEV